MRAQRKILSASWGNWSKLKKHIFSKINILILALTFMSLSPLTAEGDIVLNVHGYLGGVFSSNYNSFPVKSFDTNKIQHKRSQSAVVFQLLLLAVDTQAVTCEHDPEDDGADHIYRRIIDKVL